MNIFRICATLCATSILIGCQEPEGLSLDCSLDASDQIIVEIVQGRSDKPIESSLLIRGTATHGLGRTIRTVTVAGRQATNSGFNHAEWEVSLSRETLEQLEVGDDGATIIAAHATDACGYQSETVEVRKTLAEVTEEPPNSELDMGMGMDTNPLEPEPDMNPSPEPDMDTELDMGMEPDIMEDM